MTILQVTLLGDPVSKGRPRVNKNGHAFTPERTRAAERAVVAQVMAVMDGAAPVDIPVGLAIEFFCATRRKADLDNLVKLVTDACNQIVYDDDSQIEEITARVHRGVGKANAKTQVMFYDLAKLGLVHSGVEAAMFA